MARAISFPARASAVQNPSSSAGNCEFSLFVGAAREHRDIRLSRREDAHLGIGERFAVGGGEFDRDLMPREQVERSGRTRHHGGNEDDGGEKRLAAAR